MFNFLSWCSNSEKQYPYYKNHNSQCTGISFLNVTQLNVSVIRRKSGSNPTTVNPSRRDSRICFIFLKKHWANLFSGEHTVRKFFGAGLTVVSTNQSHFRRFSLEKHRQHFCITGTSAWISFFVKNKTKHFNIFLYTFFC